MQRPPPRRIGVRHRSRTVLTSAQLIVATAASVATALRRLVQCLLRISEDVGSVFDTCESGGREEEDLHYGEAGEDPFWGVEDLQHWAKEMGYDWTSAKTREELLQKLNKEESEDPTNMSPPGKFILLLVSFFVRLTSDAAVQRIYAVTGRVCTDFSLF